MRKLLLAAALLWSVSSLASADSVLASDPATLAKIKALRPNQAVRLGNAAVVGDFNPVARRFKLHKTGPTRRNYSIKMVWMPERERALYLGANHAVPHRLNDVWEFDLGALTWVMLYAPDNARGYRGLGEDSSDVEFKDGILVTKRGGPAIIGHAWWGLTYDPVRRQALFINTWGTDQKKAVAELGGDPGELYRGPPLWAFSPESRKWRPIKTAKPWPHTPFGGLLEYVPEYGGAIWHANHFKMRATWLYDPVENSWRDLRANVGDFATASPKTDQVAYYDPQRRAVIAQSGVRTHRFDIQRKQWSKVLSAEKGQAPRGHDSFGAAVFDPKSGHGLLLDMQDNTLWAFDPDVPEWTRLNPTGDPLPTGQNSLTYFDPAHGVFVVIEGTKVWAYRYQPEPKKP